MLSSAIDVLERRRRDGDGSEATAIALGWGLQGQRVVQFALQDFGKALEFSKRAAQVLQPWAIRPNASAQARRAYAQVMSYMGYMQGKVPSEQLAALESFAAGKRAYAGLGALDLTDLHASVGYGMAAMLESASLLALGRHDELRRSEAEIRALMAGVLARNPNYLDAWSARGGTAVSLAEAQAGDLRLEQSFQIMSLGVADLVTLTRLDPGNTNHWTNLGDYQTLLGWIEALRARPAEAAAQLQAALAALPPAAQEDTSVLTTKATMAAALAVLQADIGQDAAAGVAMVQARMAQKAALASAAKDSFQQVVFACTVDGSEASVGLIQGRSAHAASLLRQILAQLPAAQARGDADQEYRRACAERITAQLGKSALAQGDFATAELALSEVLGKARPGPPPDLMAQLQRGESSILLAIAQTRLGRPDEARRTLAPAMLLLRGLADKDEAAALVGLTLAKALYAQAVADPDQRAASLREATTLLAALPAQMQALRSVAVWSERISGARHVAPIATAASKSVSAGE